MAVISLAEPEEREDNDGMSTILEKYGNGVIVNGHAVLDQDIQVIPLSPALDVLLGGGVPEGSWVNLSSKPGVGKTTTALYFAATCQRPEYGGRDVYYLDIEGRLKKRNLRGIKGLNLDKFHAIKSTEEKILSAQDFLTIGEEILKNNKRCVLIVDSYSMLCPEAELVGGIGTSTRGANSSGYMLLSGFTRQMTQVVPVMKNIVIGIVQMMANPSGYGGPTEKGGNAIIYQADIWLRAKSMEKWDDGGKIIGQKVKWLCMKTAGEYGGIVGAEAESHIRYGMGIDTLSELIQFSIDIGLIEKSGAWFKCSFLENHLDIIGEKEWTKEVAKKYQAQGEHKLYRQLEGNPIWIETLQQDVSTMLLGKK